ncbi:hypothetical protein [Flavobacterium sp.]|uniref:hypothetical protein n=1 Tax=Flavobacterium sp. TaxID=239 RepID=UPI0031D02C70
MDFIPKDLGEITPAPDMSNFKNPLKQEMDGSIIIANFNISPISTSENKESIFEIIRKENLDSSI